MNMKSKMEAHISQAANGYTNWAVLVSFPLSEAAFASEKRCLHGPIMAEARSGTGMIVG